MPLIVELPSRLWVQQPGLAARLWQHTALACTRDVDRLRLEVFHPQHLVQVLPASPEFQWLRQAVPVKKQSFFDLEAAINADAAAALIQAAAGAGQGSQPPVQGFLVELYLYRGKTVLLRSHDFGQQLEVDLGPQRETVLREQLLALSLDPKHIWQPGLPLA